MAPPKLALLFSQYKVVFDKLKKLEALRYTPPPFPCSAELLMKLPVPMKLSDVLYAEIAPPQNQSLLIYILCCE